MIRVRLKADLTRYHAAFVSGAEGAVVALSRKSDRFMWMRLDSGADLEVLWCSVDCIEGAAADAERAGMPMR